MEQKRMELSSHPISPVPGFPCPCPCLEMLLLSGWF